MNVETLCKERRWKHPPYYFGEEWPDYVVGLSRNRDSATLENSNFETLLERLDGEGGEVPDNAVADPEGLQAAVVVPHEGHFLCGWVEWIGVHVKAADKLEILAEALTALENYPALDEDDWDERQALDRECDWHNWLCRDVERALEDAGVLSDTDQVNKNWLRSEFEDALDVVGGEWSEDGVRRQKEAINLMIENRNG